MKYVFTNPIEFKGLKFHPILLKDYEIYQKINIFLTFHKDAIADRDVIKSTYLKFMLFYMPSFERFSNDRSIIENDFKQILSYITKTDKEKINISYKYSTMTVKKLSEILSVDVNIDGITFNDYDFEEIRILILEQNNIDIEYIKQFDPRMEENLRAYYNVKKDEMSTFEEDFFALCSAMNRLPDEFMNISIYQFKNLMKSKNLLIDFLTYKPLEASGQIEFKNKKKGIKHWTAHIPKKGRYDDILVRKGVYENSDVMGLFSGKK